LKLHQQQLLFIKIHVFFYLLLFWASTYTVTYPEDTRKQQDYAGFAFQLIMINMQRKLHDFMVLFIYLSFITVRGPQFSFHFYWILHAITKKLNALMLRLQNLYSSASVSAISFQYSNLISFIFFNFIFFSNIPYSKNSFLFFYLRKKKDNHLTYQL
jgi:hypothetical protein